MDNLIKGQIWSYVSRAGEEASKLTIIDADYSNANQEIVHISVDGLIKIDKSTGDIKIWSIDHMPFDVRMITPILLKLVSNIEIESNEGYLYWREEFENGRAGVWSNSLLDVIDIIENSYQEESE